MPALTLKPAASWPYGPERRSAATVPSKFLPLAVARVVAAVARAYRIRRDTRHVLAMSDHMLKDLGLDRSEVGSVVRLGRDPG